MFSTAKLQKIADSAAFSFCNGALYFLSVTKNPEMGLCHFGVVEENEVFAIGFDADEGVGGCVECALPPCAEVVDGIAQTSATKALSTKVDDGDLLTDGGRETLLALAGTNFAVVGEHAYVESASLVIDEQTDVSECVAFAFARSSENCDVGFAQ